MQDKKTKILDGKKLAEDKLKELRVRIVKSVKEHKSSPGLAVIMVGDDPDSLLYVRNKKRACEKVGIDFHEYRFNNSNSQDEIIETIKFLNKDESVYGIIVQLPLPRKFNTSEIIAAIDEVKDVDGFNEGNLKKFKDLDKAIDKKLIPKEVDIINPPALAGVIALLEEVEDPLTEKKAVIISKNEIFACPLKTILKLKNIEAEIISPKDKKIRKEIGGFDIVISAVGKPEFIECSMVKEGSILIDVGTILIGDIVFGDFDFKNCYKKASYISPVPGGVGPLTVAYLLENVVKAWEKN